MKRLLLATLASLGIFNAGLTHAADVEVPASPTASRVIVPPPYTEWFGLYLGVIGGGGLGRTETNFTFSSAPTPATNDFEDIFGGTGAVGNSIAQGFLPTGFGKRTTAFGTAGGLVGINFQMAQFVFGIEGDFSWVTRGRTDHFSS